MKTNDWTNDIKEINAFFKKAKIPKTMQLNSYTFINDVRACLRSNLTIAIANNGKDTFLPYLERCKEIKNKMERKITKTT